jgi:CRISPR/Cas system-associated exonuclease Cas4 (RecB family)
MDYLQDDLATLRYRLCELDRQKKNILDTLIKKGLTFDEAANTILPWKIETFLYSQKYNIRGRVDTIYKTKNGLIVEDIKSHESRLDAFIHKIEHKTQLVVYAILAEQQFGIPVKNAQIFYSKDLYTESFKITNKDKNQVIAANLEARNTHLGDKPPKLEGEESVRCECCYKKDTCFGFRNLVDDECGELALEAKI